MSTELELDILRHAPHGSSQSNLARTLGFSVGKTHYVLNALIEKGLIKVERFSQSNNKLGYRYLLTPEGIQQRILLTEKFIQRKKQEYEQLSHELQQLEHNQCPNTLQRAEHSSGLQHNQKTRNLAP